MNIQQMMELLLARLDETSKTQRENMLARVGENEKPRERTEKLTKKNDSKNECQYKSHAGHQRRNEGRPRTKGGRNGRNTGENGIKDDRDPSKDRREV
jgi:hypothetical protein